MPTMLDLEKINLAITEAGPLEQEILAITRHSDERWIIQFQPVSIELECAPEQDKLMFSGVIGPVPPPAREDLLEGLLSFNTLWRDTGGQQFGFTGLGGDAILMAAISGTDAVPATIALVATNLAQQVLHWRAVLTAHVAAGEEPEPHPHHLMV
jgi:hypothetical protein